MKNNLLSMRLALRDWLHELVLSFCAVLALASMLTPLLVMHAVKVGTVEALRSQLLQDPNTLIMIPAGSGASGYTQAQIDEFKSRPDVLFAIPRTRDVAAELSFEMPNGGFAVLSLEPTAPGDPRLDYHHIRQPEASPSVSTMVLSQPAARKLGAEEGQICTARLGRKRPDGVLESVKIQFKVVGILPAEAWSHHMALMPQEMLEDIQDYRDYIAVPGRGYAGDPPPVEKRRYESFRLYARSLNDVEPLDAYLRTQGIEVITKAKEIANIRRIDESLNRILMVVALAVGAGFVAFTVSSALAAVRRKDRMLGMLRLLGFSRFALLLYPITQTLFTGFWGVLLAGGLSLCAAAGINALFSQQLHGVSVCALKLPHFLVALGVVLLLAIVGSIRPALRAACIDPSLVIRDV